MTDNSSNPTRMTFPDLKAAAFQHPLDREATDQLKMLVGFDSVVAKFLELRYERLIYVINIASSVRVGPKQFPKLHAMLKEGCAVLDLPEPELYVDQSPLVNAYTFGHTNPHIVLFTGLLDLMNDDETMTVIAHELGHIKCGHVLYSTMANSIRDISAIISQLAFGIGHLVGLSIEAALINWRRRSELSADRASLLVMQNSAPVISLLAKLAGGSKQLASQLDPAEFLNQARTYDAELEKGMLERFYRIWAELYQGNHPFAVERAKELSLWAEGPDYQEILKGNYQRADRKVRIRVKAG